jgi:hypothetical protein
MSTASKSEIFFNLSPSFSGLLLATKYELTGLSFFYRKQLGSVKVRFCQGRKDMALRPV